MKKIALLLTVLLSMTAFSGCSGAETSYFRMEKEILSMDDVHAEGTLEVFYDAELMKPYLVKALSYDDSWQEPEEIEAELASFTGSKMILIDYTADVTMKGKLDSIMMVLDCNVTVDQVKLPVGKIYFSTLDGVYVDKEVPWNAYQVARKLMPDKEVPPEDYLSALKEILSAEDYVEIESPDMEDVKDYLEIANVGKMDEDALYDAINQGISRGLNGFSTGAVSETAGGYRVYVTGDSFIKTVSQLLGYVQNNVDSVYTAAMETYKKIAILAGEEPDDWYDEKLTAEEKAEAVALFAGWKAYIDQLYQEGALDFVKPLSYERTLQKSGSTYTCQDKLEMNINGRKAAYIHSDLSLRSRSGDISFPKSGISAEKLYMSFADLEGMYNPVYSAELTWEKEKPAYGYYEDGYANYGDYGYENFDNYVFPDITYLRHHNWIMSESVAEEYGIFLEKDHQLYVPLREVAESFNEEVKWDAAAGQAYLVKDGKRVVMTGIEDEDTLYVKVRDFEKMGYTVTYDGTGEFNHRVIISKL